MTEDPNRYGIGGNKPPVVVPTDADMLADLQERYKTIPPKLEEFEIALKTFPEKIETEEQAKPLQDLLGQMKSQRAAWKGQRGEEKKPWDRIAKVVMNFFSSAEEKIEGWEATWKPRLEAYADKKRVENERRLAAEAEQHRAEAERLRLAAEAAEARRVAAEEAERQAAAREEAARAEAAAAEVRRKEAEKRAAAAAAAEKKIAAERKDRERTERERNEKNLTEIRRYIKAAAKMHDAGITDETPQSDIDQLDALVRPDGLIAALASPVFSSSLLSHEQVLEIEQVRLALGNMRQVLSERLGDKVRRKREKERKAQEERDKAAQAERDARRLEDEARATKAREEREAAEAAAATARGEAKEARADATAARREASEAYGEQKEAGKTAARLDADADRTANRADRMDRKIENSTDADHSRLRGDFTVGGITGRWVHDIFDEAALRAGFRNGAGPDAPSAALAEHFSSEDLNGAVYRWMAAHRAAFVGERVEGAIPGVLFRWERDLQIRT